MKKIGIVTVYGENNYGNKLQNYAIISFLTKLGCEVHTIRTYQSSMNKSFSLLFKEQIKKILSNFKNYSFYKYEIIREKKFISFSTKYLNITKKFDTKNYSLNFLESFDILSVGSDQVWNDSDFSKEDVEYFTLEKVNKAKKISFAASIGKDYISNSFFEQFKENLSKFHYLSCREKKGKDYIEKNLELQCNHLMDPTLLISKNEWLNLEAKPIWLSNQDYIVEYFLGGKNEKIKEIEESYSHCIIIDLMDKKQQYYTTSPEEFLYLINHSKIVLTDSFHACVFSIIFETKFLIFQREIQLSKMTSRIETLLGFFNQPMKYNDIYNPKLWKNKNIVIQNNYDNVYTEMKQIILGSDENG